MPRWLGVLAAWLAAASLAAPLAPAAAPLAPAASPEPPAGRVDDERLQNAAAEPGEPGEWLAHGRTWNEQRYSPLAGIHRENVGQLGLAWVYETGSRRGLEATPIVVDGVLYATSTWSVVFALDARTGRELWRHDPKVPRARGRDACCDVVNRGVAVYRQRVYAGTLDGRLLALDAGTGEKIWEVRTTDPAKPYTITGAPRVAKGLVFIGNGGAEFGVRGYVSAYDAETGALRWRFYTVPASKKGPHEHPELAKAAATWPEGAMWETGLGGTVWDSMAYDPELDLLYVGVGNGSVYDRSKRSPGGGDNLFLASILALRPSTGELVWHYQTVPGEHWDYTATQHMILADLEIGGRPRKVLMQAPKNGFFYVLDRATGELLSADPYVTVSWATHVDPATGRPVERPEARWSEESAVVTPDVGGGHNWHPMSFHPGTGLVYIPSIQLIYEFFPDPDFRYLPGSNFNTGEDWGALSGSLEKYVDVMRMCEPTHITAWDPVARRQAFRIVHETNVPGGLLSTAGGLLFQGNGSGFFRAYDARNGKQLWESKVGIGIMAAPVSYRAGGEQYVAVIAGVGGSHGGHREHIDYVNEGRLLAWKLGGKRPMPPVKERPEKKVEVDRSFLQPERVARGRKLYGRHCARCHGVGAVAPSIYPDLRLSRESVHQAWHPIVLEGALEGGGMAGFGDVLSGEDADAIHAYVAERALSEPGMIERALRWMAESYCIPGTWLTD